MCVWHLQRICHVCSLTHSSLPAPVRLQTILYHNPEILHAFLNHLTEALIMYVGYQIDSGAQVVQLFDSWAHHLTPEQFAEFSWPYAERVVQAVKAKYPHVPVIFHGNGGESCLPALDLSCSRFAACFARSSKHHQSASTLILSVTCHPGAVPAATLCPCICISSTAGRFPICTSMCIIRWVPFQQLPGPLAAGRRHPQSYLLTWSYKYSFRD